MTLDDEIAEKDESFKFWFARYHEAQNEIEELRAALAEKDAEIARWKACTLEAEQYALRMLLERR